MFYPQLSVYVQPSLDVSGISYQRHYSNRSQSCFLPHYRALLYGKTPEFWGLAHPTHPAESSTKALQQQSLSSSRYSQKNADEKLKYGGPLERACSFSSLNHRRRNIKDWRRLVGVERRIPSFSENETLN
jgi:hypothetical protein